MPRSTSTLSPAQRMGTVFAAIVSVAMLAVTMVASPAAAVASTALPVSDEHRNSADIGFHDYTRDGSEREIRNDLSGDLGAMVEFAQMTTVDPTGNAVNEGPTLVADRVALLLVTPTTEVDALTVEVSVKGTLKGTVQLAHPNRLPAADQTFDSRGTVAYSLRAWSAELPHDWVMPGITLKVIDGTGRSGSLDAIDVGAPVEMVINNIRLGMLTDAPFDDGQRFLNDPVWGATDYFETIPLSKLTMAKYETVELDKVIVGSGAIYTIDSPDPGTGNVYGGTMRENVGKAQVSTGINLATWGITSAPMNQRQPGSTNQRVIHHSAGLYSNGRHEHGLSGGNGMATLHTSIGNELSHELGHSYGLGHFPGMDLDATGDDVVRDASHHMDSGWGYIAHRALMRSNLDTGPFMEARNIEGHDFRENLVGLYNFNRDAMSGGGGGSQVSSYTHHTRYSLKRIQDYLNNLVADTSYPSGYRDWDAQLGAWVDAKQVNPDFNMLAPEQVGVPVFTLLGGYNPANPEQTLLYPAFRSNYGVTFDLPQVDPGVTTDDRACWVEVTFEGAASRYIALDASDGVKQLNVNLAQSDRPTGAQISCRSENETTKMGDPITIATDLEPLAAPVVVGQEHGFEALRNQELRQLEATLLAEADAVTPVLSAADMVILSGWSDDLSALSLAARQVAEKILKLTADAADVETYLAEHGGRGVAAADIPELAQFLVDNGYTDADGTTAIAGNAVTVNNGYCLYLDEGAVRVDLTDDCSDKQDDRWFVDSLGRIHSLDNVAECVTSGSPVTMHPCSFRDQDQRWIVQDNGAVVRAANQNHALDLFFSQGYPGIHPLHGGPNQVWNGFTTNVNPLLGYLSAPGLAAYVGDVDFEQNLIAPGNPDLTPGETTQEPVEGGLGDALDSVGNGAEESAGEGQTSTAETEWAGILAITGGSPAWFVLGVALVLLLSGGAVLMIRRVRS